MMQFAICSLLCNRKRLNLQANKPVKEKEPRFIDLTDNIHYVASSCANPQVLGKEVEAHVDSNK